MQQPTSKGESDEPDSKMSISLFQRIVTEGPIGISISGKDNKLEFVNAACCRILGYSESELNSLSLLDLTHPDDLKEELDLLRKLNNFEIPHYTIEKRLRGKDGGYTAAHVTAFVISDENIGAIINVLNDVSIFKETHDKLKAANKELMKYSRSLEAKISNYAHELDVFKKQIKEYDGRLERANEALKVLISGIDDQKRAVEARISESCKAAVKPILNKLKAEDLSERVRSLVNSLEKNIDEIVSSFGTDSIKDAHLLTLREQRICEMVKSGLTSKEIAKIMGVSPQTIFFHRSVIRKKLGFTGSGEDLAELLKQKK